MQFQNSNTVSRRHAMIRAAMSVTAVAGSGMSINKVASGENAPAVSEPTVTSWASFRATPDQRGIAGCELPEKPELRWELKSQDGWQAASAIVGDHVYAPSLSGTLYCLNLKTGEPIWTYRTIEDEDPKKFAPGLKAAPLVTADAVYLGDEDGFLHAVDRKTGKLMWKFATGGEIAGCVAQYEDRLLLASHDSSLYCVNRSGDEIWSFQTNDRINCSPGIADHFTFVAGCDEHLRVIDLKTGDEFRDMPLDSFLIASPAIVGDRLYVGTHTGLIVCVDWRKGAFVWKYEAPRKMPFHASAAVTDDLVIVGGHDKTVHAVERESGIVRWTFPTRARIECSGAVTGRRFFCGSGDGNLYGLSLDTGEELWKFNAGRGINAGIAIGESHMIAGEDQQNGRLLCFG